VHGSHEHIGLSHFVPALISLLRFLLSDMDRTGNGARHRSALVCVVDDVAKTPLTSHIVDAYVRRLFPRLTPISGIEREGTRCERDGPEMSLTTKAGIREVRVPAFDRTKWVQFHR
jgi:hypothetical protein